jgi:NADPH:quinone reductase-like Zn-dependent oxidoreductase
MLKKLKRVLKWTAIGFSLLLVVGAVALFIAYWMSDNDCEARRATAVKDPMKAVTYCDYGSPDVLTLEDIEKPVPGDDQVLVKVRAAALNPYDMHFMRGTPYFMRMGAGLRKPKVTRLGVDFSGVVQAVGRNVTRFQPGDEVFGGRQGALAEYVVAREQSLAKKPANISFEQAGGVQIAGLTALQALRDSGKVQPGQKVLINGASGGVGTFAVQIAKWLGAHVTGVSSTRNVELVKSLGADEAIDYTKKNYSEGEQRYDVIVDMVGNHPLAANRRVLTPNGRYVMVGGQKGNWIKPMDRVLAALVLSKFVDQHMGMMMAKMNRDDLALLADLMQQGRVTPVVDRQYTLAQAPDAMRYLEEGHARGKVVITVE